MLSTYTRPHLCLPKSNINSNCRIKNFAPSWLAENIRFAVWVVVFAFKVHVLYTKCCSTKGSMLTLFHSLSLSLSLDHLSCLHSLRANIFSSLKLFAHSQGEKGAAEERLENQNANIKNTLRFVMVKIQFFFLVCFSTAWKGCEIV